MSASPAFIRALADEASAAHQQARLAASESGRLDGLAGQAGGPPGTRRAGA